MYERKLNSFTHLTYMQGAIRHESGTDIARLSLLKRFREHMLSQYGLSEISGVRRPYENLTDCVDNAAAEDEAIYSVTLKLASVVSC